MRDISTILFLFTLTLFTPSLRAGIFLNDTFKVGPVGFSVTVPEGYELHKATVHMALEAKGWRFGGGLVMLPQKKTWQVDCPCKTEAKQEGRTVTINIAPGELDFDAPIVKERDELTNAIYEIRIFFRTEDKDYYTMAIMDYFYHKSFPSTHYHAAKKSLEKRIIRYFDGADLQFKDYYAKKNTTNLKTGKTFKVDYRVISKRDVKRADIFRRLHRE